MAPKKSYHQRSACTSGLGFRALSRSCKDIFAYCLLCRSGSKKGTLNPKSETLGPFHFAWTPTYNSYHLIFFLSI